MCRGHDTTGGATKVKGREVLPTNVKPLHYDLTLEPNFDSFTYEGTVIIDLDVTEDSNSIAVNTLDVDIKSTTVSQDGAEISSSPKITYDADKQTTTATFDGKLKANSKAQIKFDFAGTLNDQMAGFYRSKFKGPDGKPKYMATTQFEATDARRAFPCFDEPALKAKYTVTLIGDLNQTCLSNMDVASEKEVDSKITGGKRKSVTFNKTPLMSTYLLAFIISELDVIETNEFRVPVRVYAPPDQNVEHGRFSLDLAAKTLHFYETTFDSKFPLPKMDMIAIPDFAAGAMENWGLVTYRVVDVLLDPKTSGASTKERVAEVVQHELAHQWFGNLVTMDFWDGLWLNEGFATWMSWYSCNHFFPEWKVWQGYVTGVLQGALSLDALRSSHPIEVPIYRADEVNEIFDAISYQKGSCVIRMISKYLGEEVFMEGIRRYLKKHAFGNTQTTDLWAALSDASGKPVGEIMTIWTKSVGYPVLSVTENSDKKTVHLKQNRFLKTGDVRPEDDQTLYPIFLGLRHEDGIDESKVFSEREQNIEVPSTEFFKFNADHSGLFRTSYSPERLQKLGKSAKEGLLSTEDRAGMISDASALAASGYQKTSGMLGLLLSFDSEQEFVVWQGILGAVSGLKAAWVFEDEATRNAITAFQHSLVSSKCHSKGWSFSDTDDHIQSQFKSLLFACAAQADDEKVVAACHDMFTKFSAGDRTAIHPNLRGAVYGTVLRHAKDATAYDTLLNEYHTAKNSTEKNIALSSLGRAKLPELRQRSLKMALTDDVRAQDILYPIIGLVNDAEGIEALWKWTKDNWEVIEVKCPPSLTMLGSIVKVVTSHHTKEEQIKDIKGFFEERSTKGFERSLEQCFDSIRAKVGWLERDRGDVEGWLSGEGFLKKGVKSEL